MNSAIDIYVLASAKAKEIEAELKRLNRWSAEPLPSEKLENMGAFGSNTMAFEQVAAVYFNPAHPRYCGGKR